MKKQSTELTFWNLILLGFMPYKLYPFILRKGNLYVTYWNGVLQICDEEGRVGTEGNYNNIEELITRVLE